MTFRQWRATSGGKVIVSDENGKFHEVEWLDEPPLVPRPAEQENDD